MSLTGTIRNEVLAALAEAGGAMKRDRLLPECPSATEAQDISVALNGLKKSGYAAKNASGWLITTAGLAALQEAAGDIGAALDAEEPEEPATDTKAEGDDEDPVLAAIERLQAPPAITGANRKARALRALADWPALDQTVAEFLQEIAADLEAAA